MQSEINYVCSLGSCCHTAELIKRRGYKMESYPFDWLFSDIDIVTKCINDNFETLLDKKKYVSILGREKERCCGHQSYKQKCFNHIDPLNNEEDYSYLARCVSRFRLLLKTQKKKLFIIILNNNTTPIINSTFIASIEKLNTVLKTNTTNFTILVIIHYISEEIKHNTTILENTVIYELHTKSKSTGRRFADDYDNEYLDKFLDETYIFKVTPLIQ